MITTRFAPSPTGFLHVGNIRLAIINYLYTKQKGGKFILRFDDTDLERTTDEYRSGILRDLSWLGIQYDDFFKQSDRLDSYEEAKQKLLASGRLYPCYETQDEIALKRKIVNANGGVYIYDRAALRLHPGQIADYEKQGRKPHYRFLLKDGAIEWNDKIKGHIRYNERAFSDPVLIREDGSPLYTFCSVVDDIHSGITDIIRGEDHVTNTAVQMQIFEALGAKSPDFSHISLIQSKAGKISKRIGGFAIQDLRQEGIEPLAIMNLFSQLGTGKSHVYASLAELIENFELTAFGSSSTFYDAEELNRVNEKLLHEISYEDIKSRLAEIGLAAVDKEFWQSIQMNITKLQDVHEWWNICKKEVRYNNAEEDKEFLKEAAKVLPKGELSEEDYNVWMARIKDTTQRKGQTLFKPLRLALTGEEHGPELKKLLPLIDREELIARLNA